MIVVFSEERARFEAICSYFERSIPKEERWRWDNTLKRWYTVSEDIARRLARYATGGAALRLNTLSEAERQAVEDSKAADVTEDIEIPAPPGLAYLPFQRAGIFYALNRRGTLIGDEMGLGKTVQAIGVVNALYGLRRAEAYAGGGVGVSGVGAAGVGNGGILSRVLIVCPASLRLNWRAEWRRWHTGKLRPVLLDAWPGGMFDATMGQALIVSYDSVRKWHPMIAKVAWDVLICDEAHLLKDDSTRRAKSIFGGAYKRREKFEPITARRKLFLTGTAIVNKAEDLWPLVKALAPAGLGASRVDFIERYAGNSRLDELHLRLRSQIMVRRLKDDVLKELPKKRRQIVLLDVPDAASIVAAEHNALDLAKARLEQARAEIADLPHGEQVMRLRQCRSIAMTEIARVRKETALRKLPAAIEHIRDALDNPGKLVAFAHHHEVLDGLRNAFPKIATGFDGRTALPARHDAVTRFQSDRACRLFIGSKAAGLGVTLTEASTAVFVELQWTAADMDQEESRIHRYGQRNPCLFLHLVIDGSIDAKMARILVDKQAVMDAALDGGSADGRSADILEEVLRA